MEASTMPADVKRVKSCVRELEEVLKGNQKIYDEKIRNLEEKAQHFEEMWYAVLAE